MRGASETTRRIHATLVPMKKIVLILGLVIAVVGVAVILKKKAAQGEIAA